LPIWTSKTQVMAKRRVKSQIGSLTPNHWKSGIDLISLHAGGVRHIVNKLSTRATTLLQTSSQSEVYTQSYGLSKLRESQRWEFRDSHLGVSGQKTIWMWPPWRGVEYTIKGEGGGFPQVQAVVNLMSPSCPWFVLTPKVLQLCTNHLVLVLCRSVWVSKACQFFLIPSRSSSTPFYPSKVLQTREHALTPCSFNVF
jgi:hypothetical protein